MARLKATVLALGAALAGALAAQSAGLPAAALVGSTIAVTVMSALGLDPAVPDRLRDLGFAVIGVTLGASITPSFLDDVAKWPLSLAMLTLTMVAVMVSAGLLLVRIFGRDRHTAVLASAPGALSYTLALALAGPADLRTVMVLQCLRLLAITILLPPVIALIDTTPATHITAHPTALSYPAGIVLLAAGYALGLAGTRLRLPAAFLIAGILASGAVHAAGLVEGRLPAPMNFAGFAVAGAVIGTRFAGISWADLRNLGRAGAAISASGLLISAAAAIAVARALDLPFGQVWVAFAPGGVEAMASMALSLGYDPVYVATHHVFRLVLLIAFLPVMLRIATRGVTGGGD